MSADTSRAVFLSYASQDAEAARRICEALRSGGVEVWFDADGGLEHGDEWDAKIRRQIKECVLFIPIISANTQARHEGYFRIEWELAAQRAMGIASGVPFILPVVIDNTREPDALVPDRFRAVQWTRLRDGEVPPEVLQRFLKLWSHRIGVVSHQAAQTAASSSPTEPEPIRFVRRPMWLVPAILGLVAIGVLTVWFGWKSHPAPNAQTSDARIAAPLSEARRLAERAQAVTAGGSLTRAQLDTAEELCTRALSLDSTDGAVWTEAARVDLLKIYPYGYDRSDERRKEVLFRATRAITLAPDSFDARVVQAAVFAHAGGSPALLTEAEKTFRDLIANHPDQRELKTQLAEVLREQRRFTDAGVLFEQLGDDEVAGWSYYQGGQPRAALAAVNRALSVKRAVTALELKALIQMNAVEDLAAAQATIDQLQPSELLAEMPAATAAQLALYRRDGPRILEIVGALPQVYLDSNAFRGPRQFFTGLAHEMAGRVAAAEAEWRGGLAAVESRLRTAPDDRGLLLWKAWLLASLGNKPEAESLLTRAQGLPKRDQDREDELSSEVSLRLGHDDVMLDYLTLVFRKKEQFWEARHANARYAAIYDPLRDNPRFQQLLRENLPDGAKPFDEPKPVVAMPAPDSKSVAVLAFDNLSDDKGNEYFSDGISEELLTVLQKIPGLHVAARTSAFSFKGKNAPVQEIGEKLGVAYLADGSVRKAGNTVRITARLSRAATGEQVWSDSYTRDLKDFFAVQSEIAQTIVAQLCGQLTGEVAAVAKAEIQAQVQAAEKGGTKNVEAHELYLQGKFFVNQQTVESAIRAAGLLRRAVELDPQFALAWAEMAGAGRIRGGFGETKQDVEEGFKLAREAVDQAMALAPDLAAVQVARASLQIGYDFDWKGAAESLQRAMALAPSDPAVLAQAAQLAYAFGQAERAIELGRQAVALDPVNPILRMEFGYALTDLGRYDEAKTEFQRIIELSPSAPWGHAGVSVVLTAQGKAGEAVAEAAKEATGWSKLYCLVIAEWARGNKRASDAALAELIKSASDVAAVQIAWAYAFRHENDHAFEWLERAYRQHDGGLGWTKANFALASLHADPRWPAFWKKSA